MAKMYGLGGVLTGKLANTVLAVRNGEQIARKYQPVVFNPSSVAQVESRAKLKLMSQLSTVVAPIVAFRRQGTVSPRNLFVKHNYRYATYSDSQADFPMGSLDVTGGILSMAAVTVTRANQVLSFALASARADLSRVVYSAFVKSGNEYVMLGTSVVNEAGASSTFEYTSSWAVSSQTPVVVVAYGMRDNSELARATYSNMEANVDSTSAVLSAMRTLSASDVTLTETYAAVVTPGA